MVEKPRWDVPLAQQPRPEEFRFDLDSALSSIVTLQSRIPEDAFTASILGTERAGSGVIIADSGLVLTIGYLVTEAEDVWLTDIDGRVTPGHVVAVDQASGFALVQALGRLSRPALPLGSTTDSQIDAPVVLAAGGGRGHAVRAHIVAKEPFSGYWEYHLEEALFTSPAHPLWGGAGLIGPDGRLLGIGSLHVQQTSGRKREDVNMVVPIDLLPPILDDLVTLGRVNSPPRPWLGVYCTESDDRLIVADVSEDGPASVAGIRAGDVIVAVRDRAVEGLAEFYREIWASGDAGVEVPIEIVRDRRSLWVRVKTADRSSFLRRPRLH